MFGAFKKLWKTIRSKSEKSEEKKDVSTKTEATDKPHTTAEQKPKKGLFSFWKNMFKSKKKEEQKDISAPSEADEKSALSPQEKLHKTHMDLLYRKAKAESALTHENEAIKHVTTEKQVLGLREAIDHHQDQVKYYQGKIKENRKEYAKYGPKEETEVTPHDVKAPQTPQKKTGASKGRWSH